MVKPQAKFFDLLNTKPQSKCDSLRSHRIGMASTNKMSENMGPPVLLMTLAAGHVAVRWHRAREP
jgi:hypothetical protein